MRMPRIPTHAPTGSNPAWRVETATFARAPASRATALISTCPARISGTSNSSRRRSINGWLRLTTISGPRELRLTSRT